MTDRILSTLPVILFIRLVFACSVRVRVRVAESDSESDLPLSVLRVNSFVLY